MSPVVYFDGGEADIWIEAHVPLIVGDSAGTGKVGAFIIREVFGIDFMEVWRWHTKGACDVARE